MDWLLSMFKGPRAPDRAPLGLTVVCISDTHNAHRTLDVPAGDILIHAGDFTQYGLEEHAVDFNEWLGTLSHTHKYVVFGNHEANSPWKDRAKEILSNATLLTNQTAEPIPGVRVHGAGFFWNMPGNNPYYNMIEPGTDIVIAHNPPKGTVDAGQGCPTLAKHVARVRPRLWVCGHIHSAHGVVTTAAGTVVVNAANEGPRRGTIDHPPAVVQI